MKPLSKAMAMMILLYTNQSKRKMKNLAGRNLRSILDKSLKNFTPATTLDFKTTFIK